MKWKDYKNLRVVSKLDSIMGDWWQVDIFFVDEEGNVVDLENMILKEKIRSATLSKLLSKKFGKSFFIKTVAELYTKIKKIDDLIEGPTEFGLEAIAVPISISGQLSGMVLATGFFKEEDKEKSSAKTYQMLRDNGYSSSDAKTSIASSKTISKHDFKYFREMVYLVASEIETLHEEIASREQKISQLNEELGVRYKYDTMIGKSRPMQEIYSLLDKIQSTTATVLVQGENGTGKELIAKAIHYNSPRKNGPFVIQNCSAFNDNLLESELFGHVKGAFTGAIRDKKGLFEQANNGTFFLDEIGDMSLSMQVKILRVLQEGTFSLVGSTVTKKTNARIITATNKDLKTMISNEEFREDLYYRINVINIVVPPLRKRPDDIPLLCDFFLKEACKANSKKMKTLSKELATRIIEFEWPGNIRELKNEIERLVILSGDELVIKEDVLSARIQENNSSFKITGLDLEKQKDLNAKIKLVEKEIIKEMLQKENRDKNIISKKLGINIDVLEEKIKEYGL